MLVRLLISHQSTSRRVYVEDTASRRSSNIILLSTEDERSIANKLEREKKRENEEEDKSIEDIRREKDATLPARAHGNEPSRGAKIDQQIREEEEAELKRKGKA